MLSLQFVFQDGRVMSPAEAGYPEAWRSWPQDQTVFNCFDEPVTIQRLADPQLAILEDKRVYLLVSV